MPKAPTTSIFIDSYHPKTDGKCAISIRITFESKKKYYPTKYKLSIDEFEKLYLRKYEKEIVRNYNETYKTILQVLLTEEEQACRIINDLGDRFSFALFEKKFSRKRGDSENLFKLLEEKAKELRNEDRIGTSLSYNSCLVSLKKFHSKEKLILDEVTVDFLNRYKKWMLDQNRSTTTIGIYLRNVRAIYNQAIADDSRLRDTYPFGQNRGKFTIPTGRNVKKALSITNIEAIYKYKTDIPSEDRARDFWIFSYLGNGLNIKDIALLKFKNIDGDFIRFQRAKTKRVNEGSPVVISIHMTHDINRIIKKWGNDFVNKETYLFPILNNSISSDQEYKLIHLFIAFINNNMKKIASNLEIPFSTTTYTARHSFSSVLKNNSGASIEQISEALGHANIKTTQNYLSSFEDESKRKLTIGLTNFDNKLKAV